MCRKKKKYTQIRSPKNPQEQRIAELEREIRYFQSELSNHNSDDNRMFLIPLIEDRKERIILCEQMIVELRRMLNDK